jgi:hypothetical protein
MCNPAAIGAFQAAGAAQKAVGAANAGKTQQSYYNYLATQNEVQAQDVAKTSDQNVGIVSDAAGVAQQNLSRTAATVEGTQKAAEAANGVYSGSGSAEAVARDTANKAALDRAAISQNAFLQSQQIATASTNQQKALRAQAQGFVQSGLNARTAGNINAETSLLDSATSVAGSWYKWNQTSKGKT